MQRRPMPLAELSALTPSDVFPGAVAARSPPAPVVACGLRHLQVTGADAGAGFPAIVQYPTPAPALGVQIGPYRFDATLDAPIADGRFPVCLVSHGGGGSHLLYRTIGTHLAERGFIVVSPEHPGDNRNDRSRSNTDASAEQRPRDLRLALDAVLASAELGPHADPARVGVLGHSMGGTTALALLGAQAWSRSGRPLATQADARCRCGVLLAPSTGWFLAPGALSAVSAPLLVLSAQHDAITPTSQMAEALGTLLPSAELVAREVAGAGHFSFLSPFPPAMRRDDFAPSVDPPGFDRERFHALLPALVLEHLVRSLPAR